MAEPQTHPAGSVPEGFTLAYHAKGRVGRKLRRKGKPSLRKRWQQRRVDKRGV